MHDLRVSIRRLRAHFRAVRLASPRTDVHRVAARLRILMRRLSRFRDLQVQQAILGPLAAEHRSLAVFLEKLGALERSASDWLARELAAFPEAEAAGAVAEMGAVLRGIGIGSEAEARAVTSLSRRLQSRHQRLLVLRSGVEPAEPGTIHRLRVAFKKYRYLVEPVARLSGNPDPAMLSRMHDFQGAMGDIQDLAVLLHDLRSWAAGSGLRRETGPALRLLGQRLESAVSKFLGLAKELESFVFPLSAAGEQ